MKKILITGANSYIGVTFADYINNEFSDAYTVDTVDMVDGNWRRKDFSEYCTVFHVAGIAHSDSGKISEEKEKLYYSVNTDLTVETAKKAKADGVSQFIFMSSAIIYGNSGAIGEKRVITADTAPAPANCYGDSKLKAEEGIKKLADEHFNVVILRCPMIYGKNCKGNYNVLAKFAKKLPFFPYIENERSMLYTENLCEFVRLMIENEETGVFWPQNAEYVNTSEMVKKIAEMNGKNVSLVRGFTWFFNVMSHFTPLVNKAFGNLSYDRRLSEYKQNYIVSDFTQSIEKTEKE